MLSNAIKSYIQAQLKISNGYIPDIVELSGGKSEARVYRTKIVSSIKDLSGIYIIKLISTDGKWFSPVDSEENRCKELHNRAEKFHDYLVDLVASETVGDHIVLLYRQANDSVLNSDTLDKLKWTEKVKYLEYVSYELLSKMNENFRQDGRGEDFFQEILKYRLEDGGSFYHAASEILEVPTAPAILVGTKVYPNPVYYIRHQELWMPLCKEIILMRGNMHGDLHGQNIICMKNLTSPTDMQYSIIDYDSYVSNGYLLFDQAYLELYLYSGLFPENDFDQWRDTLTPLLQEGFQTTLEAGVGDYALCCRNAICGGIRHWQEEIFPHMKDDLEIQYHLARITAGGNFFSKGAITDRGTRVKFLIYMGLCFETLFRTLSFSWQSDEISPLRSDRISDTSRMDRLWQICLRHAALHTPILLTDDNCHVQDGRQFNGLSRINWQLVIDIGNNRAPNDISTWVPAQISPHRHVNVHIADGGDSFDVNANDCEWIICKKEDSAYRSLWLRHQQKIKKYGRLSGRPIG